MCGIIGLVSRNEFSSNDAINMLKRLEYRGYDSFGIATDSDILEKHVGEIKDMRTKNTCTKAICHTRWSTHGSVTEKNAHPHTDCTGNIIIVHNGIIENYQEIKKKLAGHNFKSDTDSEVIAHYFEEELKKKDFNGAVKNFFSEIQGTYAILILNKNSNKIYALKKDSPLVLGLMKNSFCVASDIYGFSNKTNRAIFFEDYEFAEISPNSYRFFDSRGNRIVKNIQDFKWSCNVEASYGGHYMIKEIMEEPTAAERLIFSSETLQKNSFEKIKDLIRDSKKTIFIAAGTSYHASLLGVYLLQRKGIDAQAIIASELYDFTKIDINTLIIAISQSGETMDVIDALKYAKSRGAKIASIVNVPYSTIQRMSIVSLELLAGQEICVASTKSFVNQAITLMTLAENETKKIPDLIKNVLEDKKIKQIASDIKDNKDIYIIGRGILYPVAREIALKLKEISYIHAEGMMGGELKHGTLALIEKGTPVISLLNGETDIFSNTKEVESRGARIIAITNNGYDFESIKINTENNFEFAILCVVAGQLLTYYVAKEKGLPIDKPRNLAKCCTVK